MAFTAQDNSPRATDDFPHALFGQAELIAAIRERIDQHIELDTPAPVDPGLTVGIMGPWGSGKSHLLNALHHHYEQQLKDLINQLATDKPDAAGQPHTLTIPIKFNAWRYEREPNLIVPLLETLNRRLHDLLDHPSTNPNTTPAHSQQATTSPSRWTHWKQKLSKVASFTSAAIKSFAAMGSAELSITVKDTALQQLLGLGSLSERITNQLTSSGAEASLTLKLNPQDAINTWRDEQKTNSARAENLATQVSIYDFEQRLHEVTRKQASEASDQSSRIHLLFLIDDLDRCLPESALEMLETIKLFFNIPSCTFVVALDDEVTERGVVHRYREYLFNQANPASPPVPLANAPAGRSTPQPPNHMPITGAEYLEKIIQIPVHLSQAEHGHAKYFLRQRFPELFDPTIERSEYKRLIEQRAQTASSTPPEDNDKLDSTALESAEKSKADDLDPDKTKRRSEQDEHQRQLQALQERAKRKQALLYLFIQAIPPQPRKLQRAAEALLLARQTIAIDTPDADELSARLTIWRLFSPELYRYCHRDSKRFGIVADWHHMASQHEPDRAWLNGDRTDLDENGLIHQTLRTYVGHERQALMRLRDAVVASYQQRSEFKLDALFKAPLTWASSDPEHRAEESTP